MEAKEMNNKELECLDSIQSEIYELLKKQIREEEKDTFQKILDSGKITPEFVFIAHPCCKNIIAEMKANGVKTYCLFSETLEKDKMYLVTDEVLKDRIKDDLKWQ